MKIIFIFLKIRDMRSLMGRFIWFHHQERLIRISVLI